MPKRDFSEINTDSIYKKDIATATKKTNKANRKSIPQSFTLPPDTVDYITDIAAINGQTRSAFLADIIRDHMAINEDFYKKVKSLRKQQSRRI